MLHTELAIVLHATPYNDKMSIVHLYSRAQGRVSYLVPQPKRRGSGMQRSLFTPFTLLEVVAERKSNGGLGRIQQAQVAIALQQLPFDPVKSSITLLLAEVVSRSVRESEANEPLFLYISSAIQLLDKMEGGVANFHLCFLIGLTSYLGFYPNAEGYSAGTYFDMTMGVFVPQKPIHPHVLLPHEATIFYSLLRINFTNLHLFRFTGEQRSQILEQIATYYSLHIAGFGQLKSLDVLKALFA